MYYFACWEKKVPLFIIFTAYERKDKEEKGKSAEAGKEKGREEIKEGGTEAGEKGL